MGHYASEMDPNFGKPLGLKTRIRTYGCPGCGAKVAMDAERHIDWHKRIGDPLPEDAADSD